MYLYVELWKPRAKWVALSERERRQYVAGIGPAIEELLAAGIELVGFAFNDYDTGHRADYTYLAVWKMPSKELAERLEATVDRSGFHDYFEQVNARGSAVTPQDALEHMAKV